MVSNHSIKQQKPLSFRNHFYLIIRNYNYRNFAKVLSNKSPCGFSFTSLQHKFSNEIFFWFIGGDNQVLLNRSCIFYLLIAILLLIQCSNIRNNKASSTKTFLNCIPYSILRIMEFNRHPMPWLQHSIVLLKALRHKVLIFCQTF